MNSNIFDLDRFVNLAQNDWAKRKKLYIIAIISFAVFSFLGAWSIMSIELIPGLFDSFETSHTSNGGGLDDIISFEDVMAMISSFILMLFFIWLMGVMLMLSVGSAFPGFRSKEKTIDYLMIPASLFEKYLYEFLFRIVAVVLGAVVIFFVMGSIAEWVHYINMPDALFVFPSLGDLIWPSSSSILGQGGEIFQSIMASVPEAAETFKSSPFATQMEFYPIMANPFYQMLTAGLIFTGAAFFRSVPVIKIFVISMGVSMVVSIGSMILGFVLYFDDPQAIVSLSADMMPYSMSSGVLFSIVGFWCAYRCLKKKSV